MPHRELSRGRKKGSKGWRESWPWVVKSSRGARRLGWAAERHCWASGQRCIYGPWGPLWGLCLLSVRSGGHFRVCCHLVMLRRDYFVFMLQIDCGLGVNSDRCRKTHQQGASSPLLRGVGWTEAVQSSQSWWSFSTFVFFFHLLLLL